MVSLLSPLLVFLTLRCAHPFPNFATKIPNGHGVPNPGPEGGVWAGVGHVTAGGGGDRNQFGLDFLAQGYEWTIELCEMDSDGDGRSNGLELGDPDCEWFEGGIPQGPAVSHPGIPDEPKEIALKSSCENYVAPDDEETLDFSFTTPNELDETPTHYRCEQATVKVPSSRVLHQIKTKVLLDNPEVLHHMFIFFCPEGSTDGDHVDQGPYECSGNESKCTRVGGWAIGPQERCEPNNVGKEFDFSDQDEIVVKLEAHYDNTSRKPQKDSSGMRVFFTPTLRPLKGSAVILGMAVANQDFAIPPQESDYALTNICPTVSTNNLDHPIYVYGFNPHMHRYGRALVTEHYRCGLKIGEIGRIDTYDFDNQQLHSLTQPIKILPGDAMVTTCRYDSTTSDTVILGGEESSDEMCLNFLSYYPHAGTESDPSNMALCMSFEHGITQSQLPVPSRFALSGNSREAVSIQFESNPSMNIADCCATNSCETQHLAVKNGACAVDSDCIAGLVCSDGLCDEPSPTSSPTTNINVETDSPTDGEASSASSNIVGAFVVFVLAAVTFV